MWQLRVWNCGLTSKFSVMMSRVALSRLAANILTLTHTSINQQSLRTLFSPVSLGIDRYLDGRNRTENQFKNSIEEYVEKMNNYVSEEKNTMIFSDDLKNMLHIATRENLDLMEKMFRKYQFQNKELRFGNFTFGPIIMRMYYHLDLPQEALKIIRDPETQSLFDQVNSYLILMDLLLEHKLYDDILSLFEVVVEKQIAMMKYPKNIVVTVTAACYKQNTKESFEYVKKLFNDMTDQGIHPIRKAITFFAGLAVNQGYPHIALEILSSVRSLNYISVKNLKVAALADMDRLDDIYTILKGEITMDSPTGQNPFYTEDVLKKVEEAVKRTDNQSEERNFQQYMNALKERSLINQKTLDSLLCQPIEFILNPEKQREDFGFLKQDRFQNRRPPPGPRRPGLAQMT